jgi:hypothetical protein
MLSVFKIFPKNWTQVERFVCYKHFSVCYNTLLFIYEYSNIPFLIAHFQERVLKFYIFVYKFILILLHLNPFSTDSRNTTTNFIFETFF